MSSPDVVFLHAPAIYDFRKRVLVYGPIGDVVPSTSLFEMYPVGFLSICRHLEKAGFSTRIINLANKMLASSRYDPEAELRRIKPKAFAVDLHWLPHVQGSLALGEILKKNHPGIPVIYGGYSATYFHQELIRYPYVDFVVRGDSTEQSMVRLMKAIAEHADVSRIPNLTYKDTGGNIRSNGIAFAPETLEDAPIDYGWLMKKTLRYLDLAGHMPFRTWTKYPVTAVFPYRGCLHGCKTCGGSKLACARLFNRNHLSVKSPDRVVAELKSSERLFKAPCMIVGDVLQCGRDYANRLLEEIGKARLRNEIALEFFTPPPDEMIAKVQAAIPKFNVEMSPESHDEGIRREFGRPFSNQQLERSVQALIHHNCKRIDLFFMIGLPGQTFQSVMDTVDYCGMLLEKFGEKKNLHPFMAPLAPFLDPGSEIWEEPERFGYKLFARTLQEHRALMEGALSWKYFLNYETRWMTRDEIVSSTYEAALRMNDLKRKHGILSEKEADRVQRRAEASIRLMGIVDDIVRNEKPTDRDLSHLKAKIEASLGGTLCDPEELRWPVGFFRFNLPQILGRLFQRDA